jgi:putative membrane protein
MPINPQQQASIEAAFRAAQGRTRAPIVCVLARASADYEIAPLLWSGLLALVTPWPLLIFTQLSAQRIFLAQLVVCLVAGAILSLLPQRVLLTPARVRRANAHRAALVQFALRGLEHVAGRNGVLVYVSLAERYARVIAADAAAQAIDQGKWQGLVDALVADLRDRGAAEGLTTAAASCAALLAPAFPAAGDASPQHRQHFHIV